MRAATTAGNWRLRFRAVEDRLVLTFGDWAGGLGIGAAVPMNVSGQLLVGQENTRCRSLRGRCGQSTLKKPVPGCGASRPEVIAVTRALGPSADAALHGLPAVWPRDNCPCPLCRDARSGQRLVSITDQPADVWIASVRASAYDVGVVFGPDGHQAVFVQSWLAEQEIPREDGRCEDAKRLWAAADLAARIPAGCWPRYLADPAHRAECLEAILRDGFMLLRDVPCEPGAVLAVAGSMGYVRETNYGRRFDVRVEATPAGLARTRPAIAPHTDEPYRDPVPTVRLLHCRAVAADGGDWGLVDGFGAAGVLRAEDPAASEVLAGTPVTFAYSDVTAELRATGPMIGLDPRGRIREIRFDNRLMQPLRCGSAATSRETAAQMAAFYAAYRSFAGILIRPDLLLTFRLAARDCASSTTPGSCPPGPASPRPATGTCKAVTRISTASRRRSRCTTGISGRAAGCGAMTR